MGPLSEIQIEIIIELLNSLKKSTYHLSYGELSKKLFERTKIQLNPHTQLPHHLGEIGKYCKEKNVPMLNSMLISNTSYLPGHGFKELYASLDKSVEGKSTKELYEEENKRIREYSGWQRFAKELNIDIVMPARGEIIYPQDVNNSTTLIEGAKKSIVVNSYERNVVARKQCIDHYSVDGKISCQICGFNFGAFYGNDYENLIEVHHIVPISKIGKNYKVDPEKDLIPVCPNCHMVLHSMKGESIEKIKSRINKD